MALIKCPECGKDISDKAIQCIHCGYPLSEINNKNVTKTNVELSDKQCPCCKVKKQHIIKDNIKEVCSVCGYVFNEEYVKQHEDLLPKQTPNQVHCPYCNSTNVNKISGTKKAVSIIGFGILSNKIGKQWHCNNCKSDF